VESPCKNGEDDMTGEGDRIFAFFNPSGRMLSFFTSEFISCEPDLAKKLLPVSLAELESYEVREGDKYYPIIRRAVDDGECAAMFYPAKRNEMKTVFFFKDGECFVRKDVSERLQRRKRFGFRQLKIDSLPVYRGPTVYDVAVAAAISHGEDGVVEVLIRFVEEVMARYPGVNPQTLLGVTFDAIPANCVLTDDGRYNFFDLEYEMIGGVPLGYLIERIAMTTAPRMNRENNLRISCYRIAERLAERFGVNLDWCRYKRVCAAHKKFNTLSLLRILTNIWLSFLPVKSWRERFCWWLNKPELKT
jgi:hypothetical protein